MNYIEYVHLKTESVGIMLHVVAAVATPEEAGVTRNTMHITGNIDVI